MSPTYRQCIDRRHLSAFALTPGQWEVMTLVARDYTQEEIAARLGVSLFAVKARLRRVLMRLNVRSTRQALFLLSQAGLLAGQMGPDDEFNG